MNQKEVRRAISARQIRAESFTGDDGETKFKIRRANDDSGGKLRSNEREVDVLIGDKITIALDNEGGLVSMREPGSVLVTGQKTVAFVTKNNSRNTEIRITDRMR
jgi:hypothetical protein